MKAAIVFLSLLTAVPAPAQTVEERLTRLEEEVRALRAENAELRRRVAPPAAPATAPASPAAPKQAEAPRVTVGGLLQIQGESGARLDSRFGDDGDRLFVRRARVNLAGSVAKDFDYRVEMDLAGSLGASSGMRAQLTDAYAGWSRGPGLALRAGQMKTPFGFEQLHSDARLFTPERALATDRIGVSRQLGVLASGAAAGGIVKWSAGAFNGNGTNASVNDDEGLLVAARVAGTLVRGGGIVLTTGTNVYRSNDVSVSLPGDFGFDLTPSTPARDNLFSGARRAWGLDAQLVAGRAEFWGELLRSRFEPENRMPRAEVDASGWYVQGAWFLRPGVLQAVLRREAFDPSGEVAGDDTATWLAGANYLVRGHDLKLQLHFMRSEVAGRTSDRVIARVQTVF